jgi:hypothetical protein
MIEYILLDGAPDAGKLARPVWSRGKAGDYIKGLPIATLVQHSNFSYGK